MAPKLLEFKFFILAVSNLINFQRQDGFHMLPHLLFTPCYAALFRLVAALFRAIIILGLGPKPYLCYKPFEYIMI